MNNSQHNAFMKTAQMGFLKAFTRFIITGFGKKNKEAYLCHTAKAFQN